MAICFLYDTLRLNLRDMVKHELRVESLKEQVESLKARVEIQKCEFKSNLRVTSLNPRVQESLKTQ